MTALLDSRYALPDTVAPNRLVRAYDELLERSVDVLVLDPVPDELARERLLRRLRRLGRAPDRWRAPVLDTGTSGERPFLVVPPAPRGTLADLPPLPPDRIVSVALQAIDAILALRRAGAAPAPLLPELVRLGPEGTVELVAVRPWPPEPDEGTAAPPEGSPAAGQAAGSGAGTADPGVRQVAGLVARLLERSVQEGEGAQTSGLGRLQAVVGRALGMAGPPLHELPALAEELMAWQDARVLRSSARDAPAAAAPTGSTRPGPPPLPPERPGAPAPEPATEVIPAVREPPEAARPAATSAAGPAPGSSAQSGSAPPTSEPPTETIPRVGTPAMTGQPPADPAGETAYVPLSKLLHDGETAPPERTRQETGGRTGLLRWRRHAEPRDDDSAG